MAKSQWIHVRVEQRYIEKLEVLATETGLTTAAVMRSLIDNASIVSVPVPISFVTAATHKE